MPGEQQVGESRAHSLGLIQQLPAKPMPQLHRSLSLATHRGAQDDEAVLVTVLQSKVQHLLQGELGTHVRVEDEECISTTCQDLVTEVVDAPSRAQSRILLEVPARERGLRDRRA